MTPRERIVAAVRARLELAQKLRAEGLSYRAIGQRLGITGQRVWQLLHPTPAEDKPESVRGYLLRRKREIEAHAALMRGLVVRHGC